MINYTNRGFTLIELLVVISIIGMLSSITLVALNSAKDKASIGAAQTFAKTADHSMYSWAGGMWSFDNASNMGEDTSGNNNHLTFNGSPNQSTDSPYPNGKSISFNGSYYGTKGASSSLNPGNGSFTAMFWVKANSLADGVNPHHWLFNNNLYGVAGANNFWVNFSGVRSSVYTDPAVIEVGKWIHVTWSYNMLDGNVTVYKNGKLIKTQNVKPAGTAMDSNSVGIYVGYPNYESDGYVDDVRIFSKSLLASDIQSIYASTQSKYLASK